MQGRRKTDKALFFAAVWAILLGLTNMMMDYGILVPITKVGVTDRVAIVFTLPTLTVIVAFGIFYLLKSRGE